MSVIDQIVAEAIHVRPLNDYIVVFPIADESEITQTASGIYIDTRSSAGGVALPDVVENEPVEGRIVALGSGVRHELPTWLAEKIADDMATLLIRDGIRVPEDTSRLADRIATIAAQPRPFSVKVGDRILWTPWAAFTITLEGVDYFIITEDDIVGIVSE